MSALDAAALLAAWEEGVSQAPVQRALTLLAATRPETSVEDWSHASLGQRDASLLSLREELFGPSMDAASVCPRCDEPVEILLTTQEIRVDAPPVAERLRVDACGYQVEYRLPTSADLIEIVQRKPVDGRESLLRRCVRAAWQGGVAADATTLPAEVVEAVTLGMASADPQADVQVALTCPACGHSWSMVFDVLSYLWNEIEDLVGRLLREIHTLASVYGWSEHDILAMSPRRRRLYLEMIGA